MTKKNNLDSNWIVASVVFGVLTFILFILLVYFPESTGAYKKGFEDGQKNITIPLRINSDINTTLILDSIEDWENYWAQKFCISDHHNNFRMLCLNKDGTWTASWRDK